MDDLRIEIRKLVVEGIAKNNYEAWSRRDEDDVHGIFGFDMSALAIAKKTVEFLNAYKKFKKQQSQYNAETDGPKPNPRFLFSERHRYDIDLTTTPASNARKYKNDDITPDGIDISEIQANVTASSILGVTPEKILAAIPKEFRVLHLESVVRTNLHNKFLKQQALIREQLLQLGARQLRQCIPDGLRGFDRNARKEDLVNYLVTPQITFHGTSNQYVPSIVRYGFFKPGQKDAETGEKHEIRCGSTYGQGIYSSPSAQFGLDYSDSEAKPTSPSGFWGLKLIVCATIMGRSRAIYRDDNWRDQSQPYEGADSHVGNMGLEYIVFSTAQILPVYVIHMDWGQDNQKHFNDIPVNASAWRSKAVSKRNVVVEIPGDKQRKKEALMAKAAKYFPYGFGPATGTRFVVEDVGEVDDDEEEFGDYQEDRLDGVQEDNEEKKFWHWDFDLEQEGSVLDEYGDARRTYTKLKKH